MSLTLNRYEAGVLTLVAGLLGLGCQEAGPLDVASTTRPALCAHKTWEQKTKLTAMVSKPYESLGNSVSVDADAALVGDVAHDGIKGATNSGAAYIFARSGTAWIVQQKLTATVPTAYDWFGYDLSLSADTALVGMPKDDTKGTDSGSAFIYLRSGTTWGLQVKLTAFDGANYDFYGGSVAIHGDTAIIGAQQDSDGGQYSGAAYVYKRSGITWKLEQKLLADNPATLHYFGNAVAIHGDTAVVGAYRADDKVVKGGAAYIYLRTGTTWATQQKLTATAALSGIGFGTSVGVHKDTVVVGSPEDSHGTFTKSGSAYVYKRTGTTWSEQNMLTASGKAFGAYLGWRVAVNEDVVLTSALQDSPRGAASGSAYLFYRSGTTWSQAVKLTASDGLASDRFGSDVSISLPWAIVGAAEGTAPNYRSGSAYTFTPLCIQKNGAACTTDSGCTSGYCVDGVCCDGACGMGLKGDCQACSKAAGAAVDGTCGTVNSGVTCRGPSAGCDKTETCDGTSTSCPADSVSSLGTVCRVSSGKCDQAETCDGISAECPVDTFLKANTICRVKAGSCDIAEFCTGTTAKCPTDTVAVSGTICRPIAGNCDQAESCTGGSAMCPADTFKGKGVSCRAAYGMCDLPETCTGSAGTCPVDTLKPSGTVCRAKKGACDAAETCDGKSLQCPANTYLAKGKTCRKTAGICDVAEVCSGSSAACPSDMFAAVTKICRQKASECDIAELCSGIVVGCPANMKLPNGTPCKNGAGQCVSGLCLVTDAGSPDVAVPDASADRGAEAGFEAGTDATADGAREAGRDATGEARPEAGASKDKTVDVWGTDRGKYVPTSRVDEGCSCTVEEDPSTLGLGWLLFLGALWLKRRRREGHEQQ